MTFGGFLFTGTTSPLPGSKTTQKAKALFSAHIKNQAKPTFENRANISLPDCDEAHKKRVSISNESSIYNHI